MRKNWRVGYPIWVEVKKVLVRGYGEQIGVLDERAG